MDTQMKGRPLELRRSQRGAVALFSALAILILVTAVTIAAVNVGIGEQRSSANEVRKREAASIAEAGIERGIAYLRQNRRQARSTAAGGWMATGSVRWTSCTDGATAIPCGDGHSKNFFDSNWTYYSAVTQLRPATAEVPALKGDFTVHYVARADSDGAALPGNGVYYVLAQGQSADGGARALVRRGTAFYPFLAQRPDAPLIAAGTVGFSGTISVVANPNGGGKGVPLSVWSGGDVTEGGSTQTCHIQEFLDSKASSFYTYQDDGHGNSVTLCVTCTCPNTTGDYISRSGVEGIDVLDIDGNSGANPDSTNFPSDVFQYLFGVPVGEWRSIRDQAQLITSVSSLTASSAGLYWITGEADIQQTVGSIAEPVILVVHNGNFKMNANATFFGVVFIFREPGYAGTINVALTGGPTLYGSIIANTPVDLGNGNYTARYSTEVLDNLVTGGPSAGSALAAIPGSWADYSPE